MASHFHHPTPCRGCCPTPGPRRAVAPTGVGDARATRPSSDRCEERAQVVRRPRRQLGALTSRRACLRSCVARQFSSPGHRPQRPGAVRRLRVATAASDPLDNLHGLVFFLAPPPPNLRRLRSTGPRGSVDERFGCDPAVGDAFAVEPGRAWRTSVTCWHMTGTSEGHGPRWGPHLASWPSGMSGIHRGPGG